MLDSELPAGIRWLRQSPFGVLVGKYSRCSHRQGVPCASIPAQEFGIKLTNPAGITHALPDQTPDKPSGFPTVRFRRVDRRDLVGVDRHE